MSPPAVLNDSTAGVTFANKSANDKNAGQDPTLKAPGWRMASWLGSRPEAAQLGARQPDVEDDAQAQQAAAKVADH
jgi:hypothetical protein